MFESLLYVGILQTILDEIKIGPYVPFLLGQGPPFPQNWVPFLNIGCKSMLFFNIASVLRLFRIFDRQFLQFSGLVGQTVSEYLRLGDRQFQIF